MSTLDGGSAAAETLTAKLAYHREMFLTIDRMINELDNRFSANRIELAACDTIYPGRPNFLNCEIMEPLVKLFGSHVSIDSLELKNQLCVVIEILKEIKSPLQSLEDIMQLLWPMKTAFPDTLRFFSVGAYTSGILGTG